MFVSVPIQPGLPRCQPQHHVCPSCGRKGFTRTPRTCIHCGRSAIPGPGEARWRQAREMREAISRDARKRFAPPACKPRPAYPDIGTVGGHELCDSAG